MDLTRVLAFRARATGLDRRLAGGCHARAAYGGLKDSAPRAALVALHARLVGGASRPVNGLSGRIFVDGRVAGAWGRERERVAIHLWRPDDPDRERIAADRGSVPSLLAGPPATPTANNFRTEP